MRQRSRRSGVVTLLAVAAVIMTPSPLAGAPGGTGSLSGTVTAAATGQPIAGVCATVFDGVDGSETDVVTDAAGRWRLEGLTPGPYTVSFNRCPAALPAYAVGDFTGMLELEGGEHRTGVDASLPPAGTIRGTVTDDATGQPIAGICVGLWDEAAKRQTTSRPTGPDGVYEISRLSAIRVDGETVSTFEVGGLPEGPYAVLFDDCNEVPLYVSERHDDRTEWGEGIRWADPVWLPAGGVVTVDGAMTLGGAVAGDVTSAHTGRPALTCVALLDASSFEPVAMRYTGSLPGMVGGPAVSGRYTFGGVAPGRYIVSFDPSVCGGLATVPEWWDDATAAVVADVIVVGPGDVLEADAVLAPAPASAMECEGAPPASWRFDDVHDSDVHAPSIGCLFTLDVVRGTSRHAFSPHAPVTRGQLATMLARALTRLAVELPAQPPDAFTDDDGTVHELAVNQLVAAGVMSGTAGGRAAVAVPVTRGQTASLLVRAYTAATATELRSTADRFVDDDHSVHEAAIDRAVTAALARGTTASTFHPDLDVSRAQAAAFVDRLLGRAGRDLLTATW